MRLALLSDLHFGRTRADLVQPLLDALAEAQPDMIVIAGDFVQRARPSHYRQAREFLDRLQSPWFAVPGNHDIPLWNLLARAFTPRRAYRRWITEETEPLHHAPGVVVVGVDTTKRWNHQSGEITGEQIARVSDLIEVNGQDRIVVVVAHHPFHQDEWIEKKLMSGAPAALEAWAEAGPHMILSGHLHVWKVEPFVARQNRSMTLQVHCGTGLSTRLRGQPNDFAIVDLDGPDVRIERFSADIEPRFASIESTRYVRGSDGWIKDDVDTRRLDSALKRTQ